MPNRDVSERVARFDLALAIAVLYAAGATAITIAIIGWSESTTPWLTNLLAVAGTAAAWGGVFAWRRGRSMLAALGFFLSLAQPVGYIVEITGPLAIALTIVSLIRAIRDRRDRRRANRAVLGPVR